MNNMNDIIGRDPYHIAQAQWQRLRNLRGDSIKTGRISSEGGLGNWTGIQNLILECIPLALHNTSSSAVWKLLFYLFREILGRTRNGSGNPKTYINYRFTIIMKKSIITSPSSLVQARKILEDKRIIYFNEEEGKRLFLNIFPLTWIIEDEDDRMEIRRITEKEIERIYTKIEKETTG